METKDGLHIWEDHFYPEVVNPLTDEPVAEGQVGELVFTSLTKQAMPVMRYRTRDLTRLLPGTARPGFRRMEKVTGRTDDMMIVRGVNVFPTQIEEIILGVPGLSPYFQCVLTRPGRMDELTVNVEADPAVPEASYADLGRVVAARVKDRVGSTCRGRRRRARQHRAVGRQGPADRRPAPLTVGRLPRRRPDPALRSTSRGPSARCRSCRRGRGPGGSPSAAAA